jgi:low affinity Fe/Cu permease
MLCAMHKHDKHSHPFLLASSSSHNRSHPFTAFSKWVSARSGHPLTFAAAVGIIIVWIVSGPFFGYSETWQLMINTGTTIVTFLMVFLIQNSTNRDSAAVQIKLDELIRADKDAHTVLLDLEQLTEKELLDLKAKYEDIARKSRIALRKGKKDTGRPSVRI